MGITCSSVKDFLLTLTDCQFLCDSMWVGYMCCDSLYIVCMKYASEHILITSPALRLFFVLIVLFIVLGCFLFFF